MRPGRGLTVAVLAGGRSSEHEVSLASGEAVRSGLERAGHRTLAVEIGRDGVWRHAEQALAVRPGAGLLDADLAFPVLHGPFGEDGTVQGLLECLDVPYVGAGVTAAAVCMDKVLFKELMKPAGVPQVDYEGVHAQRWHEGREAVLAVLARLGLPVFVKPARLGSSVGIVKVAAPGELPGALEEAFAHDALVIVEAMAAGIEVECSVLGCPPAGRLGPAEPGAAAAVASQPGAAAALTSRSGGAAAALISRSGSAGAVASEPGEIVLESGWYDFQAKYTPGAMELVLPARISAAARERVRELAVDVFLRVGCEGLARVDFFVDGERVLVNELNTMPGFTATSVYARLFEASGVAYPELVDRLCRLALERHAAARAYAH